MRKASDLQPVWLELLEAELARRQERQAWHAGEGKRRQEKLWSELERIGQQLVAPVGAAPPISEGLITKLVLAPGWAEVDQLRIPADLAPAEAVAVVATKDPEAARRLLSRWSSP